MLSDNVTRELELNNSSSTVFLVHMTFADILTIVGLSLVIICAVLGNILVIVSVAVNKRLRTVTNCFVVSLAFADLLVATTVMPFAIAAQVTKQWQFGRVLCDIYTSLDVMLCTASILNLCCISLDRYMAVTRPLMYATCRTTRLALFMVAGAWVLSCAITMPPIIGWRDPGYGKDETACYISNAPGYVVYSACGSFYIPMFIMVYVYWRIFKVARERERNLRPYRRQMVKSIYTGLKMTVDSAIPDAADNDVSESEAKAEHRSSPVSSSEYPERVQMIESGCPVQSNNSYECDEMKAAFLVDSCPSAIENVDHGTSSPLQKGMAIIFGQNTSGRISKESLRNRERQKAKERAILRKERKAATTLAVVVGAFTGCWLPFFVQYIIAPFCNCSIPTALISFTVWLGYINSACNPCIYAFYNKEFRYSFWKLTFGRLTSWEPKAVSRDRIPAHVKHPVVKKRSRMLGTSVTC